MVDSWKDRVPKIFTVMTTMMDENGFFGGWGGMLYLNVAANKELRLLFLLCVLVHRKNG